MNSTTSNGQPRRISSVRADGGPNTDACLTLGRKLAEYVEPHDLAGSWMAHHLAKLIMATEDETATTVEQRIEIVDTILKLWMNRRSLPGKFPGDEFERIFTALDGLGDKRPWRYARLHVEDEALPDPETTQLPLVVTAADLERLVRETVRTLILVAHDQALEAASEWVEASSAINAEFEGELASVTTQIRHRLREYQGLGTDEDSDPADDETEGAPTPVEVDDQRSDYNHARRLREMADLLNNVASALYPEMPASTSD